MGIPARVIMPRDKDKAKKFVAYGTPTDGVPDPVARMIDSLRSQVTTLMERVDELAGRLPEGGAPDHEETVESESDGVEKIPSVAASGRKP